MANLPYAQCVLAFLVCLGPLPALAQDNPWRVPQYQGNGWQNRDYAPQANSGGWSQSQPHSDSWAGGYAGNGYAQNGYSGNGYADSQGAGGRGSTWPAPESQGSPQRSWEPEQRPQRQARGHGAPAEGYGQNRGYSGYAQDYPGGGRANQGYNMPPAQPQVYLYGRQYGEFPPLEGAERKHSAERLQVQPARLRLRHRKRTVMARATAVQTTPILAPDRIIAAQDTAALTTARATVMGLTPTRLSAGQARLAIPGAVTYRPMGSARPVLTGGSGGKRDGASRRCLPPQCLLELGARAKMKSNGLQARP